MKGIVIKVNWDRLSDGSYFMERKPGTVHIGSRFVPFDQFWRLRPCIYGTHPNDIGKLARYFMQLNDSEGKRTVFSGETCYFIYRIKR